MSFNPRRGDTLPLSITIRLDGSLYDLTGCTVKFSYQNLYNNHSGSMDGVVSTDVDDTAEEKATATFTPSYTTFNIAGSYKYDIQVDDGSLRFTPSYGEFEVLEDITV